MTDAVPKPLVEVGGYPILWHIMQLYARNGFSDFLLALGYMAERVRDFVNEGGDDWQIRCVDTGLDTNTGGRLKRLQDILRGDVFFATYGDGLSNIDLRRLLDHHLNHGRAATVTVVRPQLQFGMVELDGDGRVQNFREKPRLDGWVNGGFFVFDRRIFDYLHEDSVLEEDPMQRLAANGDLIAFPHDGYWTCMDTYKDTIRLNEEWASGRAPWCT
jgi:glucose-1-phosphate cytidylyltransferase